MVFWLYGAEVAFGPEKFGFWTVLSPSAVMVRVTPEPSPEPSTAVAVAPLPLPPVKATVGAEL